MPMKVEYGPMRFNISSDRVYEKDEEIYISYGNHGNDFLLAEYGFSLSENKWDEIQLDHVILSELSARQRGVGFLGKDVLDQRMVYHRTKAATWLIYVPSRKWYRFVRCEDDGEEDQAKADQILLKLLTIYEVQAKETSEHFLSLKVGHVNQRQMLNRRWKQILALIQAAVYRIRKC